MVMDFTHAGFMSSSGERWRTGAQGTTSLFIFQNVSGSSGSDVNGRAKITSEDPLVSGSLQRLVKE